MIGSLGTEKCIMCGKPTIPCIRYFTNEDGKIIQEYCNEHEEQIHSKWLQYSSSYGSDFGMTFPFYKYGIIEHYLRKLWDLAKKYKLEKNLIIAVLAIPLLLYQPTLQLAELSLVLDGLIIFLRLL